MSIRVKAFTNGPITGKAWLGIDPSLTGFAVCVVDEYDTFYSEVWTPDTRGAVRLDELRSRLDGFLEQYPVEDIAMEGTIRQSQSASVLGELSGVIKHLLYSEWNSFPLCVPPMSLKKYVSGSGKAVTKSQIMLSVFKKWGADLPNDNAADAYGLARISSGKAGTAYEKEVLAKLNDTKYRV